MRMYLFIGLLSLLYLTANGNQVISLEDGTIFNNPSNISTTPYRNIEKVEDGLVVTYNFNYANLQPDNIYNNTFWWGIEGFGFNVKAGEAAVPTRVDLISVPSGKLAEVNILEQTFTEIPVNLTPAREPLRDNGIEEYTINNVPPIFLSNNWLPEIIASPVDLQSYRGNKILSVQVSPVQYNSNLGVVRAYKKIVYKINFIENDYLEKGSAIEPALITADDFFLQNITLNGVENKGLDADFMESNLSQKYLILSLPKYSEAISKFSEWKKLLGFTVEVELRESWDPSSIKNYIRDCYRNSPSLYYVLLVGDQEDVPAQFSTLIQSHFTDYQYFCIETNDMINVYGGRLPVSTPAEAMVVVNKIINYEKNPVTKNSFYNQGINCAYFQDNNHDGYEDRRFVKTSEEVRDYLMSQGKTIERIYKANDSVFPHYWNNTIYSNGECIPTDLLKPGFTWIGDASDIKNAINEGVFYALHRDHGSPNGWGDPSFRISDVNSLRNGDKLPVVFSMNCQTGKFNDGICFAEAFLRNPNGGCVGIIAATEISYSGPNDILTTGMFDAIWPNPGLSISFPTIGSTSINPSSTPIYRLGPILSTGLNKVSQLYVNYDKYTKEIFHCFGDPSMMIYTALPTPYNNPRVHRYNNRISVSTGGEEARISFYDLMTGEVTCLQGKQIEYFTTHPNSVSICISGHNKVPYLREGTVLESLYLQNVCISESQNFKAGLIHIGSNVDSNQTSGPVVIDGGEISLIGSEILLAPQTTITKGAIVAIEPL